MSFSSDTKKELSEFTDSTRHCRLAELTAISGCCGQYVPRAFGRLFFLYQSENFFVIKTAYDLIRKLFHASADVSVISGAGRQRFYMLLVRDEDVVKKMLFEMKLLRMGGALVDLSLSKADLIPKNICCKRAYLRGLFLCFGSISDPHKAYRLEYVCDAEEDADEIAELLSGFDISVKKADRKGKKIVYIKEGEKISSALGVIGARKALLEFENIRILRDISGNVNRQVNCETANMNKAAVAGAEQIRQIRLIDQKIGLDNIAAELSLAAKARLDNPEMNLKELGETLSPPVGKSGMYHRFAKIKKMAEEL